MRGWGKLRVQHFDHAGFSNGLEGGLGGDPLQIDGAVVLFGGALVLQDLGFQLHTDGEVGMDVGRGMGGQRAEGERQREASPSVVTTWTVVPLVYVTLRDE